MPVFPMTSLAQETVVLPDAAKARIAIVIAGFTKSSSTATGAWRQRADKDFAADPRVVVYEAAILEDVPRLIRGMVVGSMRKNTPGDRQHRLLITYEKEAEWKRIGAYGPGDHAYVFLLDDKGEIVWRGHGLFTEGQYATLAEHTRRLAESVKVP